VEGPRFGWINSDAISISVPTPSHYIGREAKATATLVHSVMWRTKITGSKSLPDSNSMPQHKSRMRLRRKETAGSIRTTIYSNGIWYGDRMRGE
jgi:hypothetical protein